MILEFCVNKEGSRLIQDKIEIGNAQEVKLIFEEMKKNFLSIINDQSGNYCVQKILEGKDMEKIQ